MNHLLTVDMLSSAMINDILTDAESISRGEMIFPPQNPTFMANLFFEPSTRTRCGFEVAEKRLGLQVLNIDEQTSSIQKGESLYDTVRFLEEIGARGVVIRHQEERYFDQLVDRIHIPILNAGDGCGHHPTQSLLDLFTIRQEFGYVRGLTVVIAGDLRHSRVARSNANVLSRFGAKLVFTGPKEWVDGSFDTGQYMPFDDAVCQADVLMLLRIQHERHSAGMNMTKGEYYRKYGLTPEREKCMKPHSIIMHPAPINRDVEIASELVECERSRIFKQMGHGVATRMAALRWALGLGEENNHGALIKEWELAK